jgi:signal transduction histidine kinase
MLSLRALTRLLPPLPHRARGLAYGLQPGDALAAAAVLAAYVGLEWISFIHEHKGVPVTPWNPGLGVAFGLLVLKGAAFGLVLFAGVVFAETLVLHTDLAWPVILAIAAVVSASYSAAAALARKYLRLDVRLTGVRDVLVLLGAGAAGAAVVALALGALLLTDKDLGPTDLSRSVLPLFVGDVIGIAVVTPLVLRLSESWKELTNTPLAPLAAEVVLFLLAVGFALWMIVGSDRPNDYKYFSLLFLPVAAIGVRHGIDGACLALAATQLSLVGMLNAYGHDAATFTEFQVVMFVLTMTGLLVGVVVSERRRADAAAREAEARLQDSQFQASRAARISVVGGMASALAHEINQPMTAARALARSAQHVLNSPHPDLQRAGGHLGTLVAQIDHAAGVVRRMREFLRRGQPGFSTLEVRPMLEDALALAGPESAAGHTRILLEVDAGLPVVFGDRVQLQQVVLNLLRNAMDAIAEARPAEGRIEVRASMAEAGKAVEIAVRDNGAGVPPTTTLFHPLSSSKADGLGLGLSICANIMQAHGGRIWLAASVPGATEFRLSLPVEKQDHPRP